MKTLGLLFVAALCLFAQGSPGLPKVTLQTSNQASITDTYANVAATTCNSVNQGQIGYTTDSVYVGVCNSSAWAWYYQGQAVTPPPTTGWTLEGQAGNTVTANADGTVTFFFARRNAQAINLAYRTGATTQTITSLACSSYGNIVNGTSDTAGALAPGVANGLGLRDSAAKSSAFYWTIAGATDLSPIFYISVDRWTNSTTYASSPAFYPSGALAASPNLSKMTTLPCHWLRVKEDGTNAFYYWNLTGSANNWVQFYTEAETTYLAAGAHSPAIIGYNNVVGSFVTLVSWLAQ